ncbi:hypothetical protein [Cyanothece sp. BG0011]|uniref:hypothetical protein n=1 Tax=Cyanothece sp. BG0011 TaxID=2082950 RepID=UPI000D1D67D7|nr:hypothetical protein [Cyanothece sp. BG0011]
MLILPLVLDIAIGLVFIYISLSLIASEIQEIISTLLEFRAKHLKTSIQYLLMGSDIDSVNEIKQTKQLIDELYDNPLIKNLNHQSQGNLSYWVKTTNPWRVDTPTKVKNQLLKRLNQVKDIDLTEFKNEMEEILNNKKIQENSLDVIQLKFKQKFNQLLLKQSNQTNRQKLVKIRTELLENKTLPSYIPSETFATTLLESLQIPQLTHCYSSDKFKGVIKRLIKKLSELENLDSRNLEKFIKETKEIYDDFSDQKYKLEVSLLRVKARLNELILDNDNDETTRQNLKSIKNTFFEGKNFEILCHELKLNLIYIAQFLELDGSEIKRGEFEKN